MSEYIQSLVVKLHLTPNKKSYLKKNYVCTCKIHNEILNKYKAKYGDSEITTNKSYKTYSYLHH